jgi:hypothetical protein
MPDGKKGSKVGYVPSSVGGPQLAADPQKGVSSRGGTVKGGLAGSKDGAGKS